jgi:SAM-dependent methyltransferase
VAIAAMRVLTQCDNPEQARVALERALELTGAAAPEPLRQFADLLRRNPLAWETVHAVVGAVIHGQVSEDPVCQWARQFDQAVAVSPEASVALYSLGDAEALAAVTGEIVCLFEDWNLLGGNRSVLDVGCGIGRLETALSPYVQSIVGLDIAPAMLAEASRRCAGLPNVQLVQGGGYDLAEIRDEAVDLVVYVDCFPYLVLSEGPLAARHVAESTRVLGRGGDLVILNLSYRGDVRADTSDLIEMAEAAGLRVEQVAERPLRLWDAPAFHLRKI